MIMHLVKWGVGVPTMEGMKGVPGITGTECPKATKGHRVQILLIVLVGALLLGTCAAKQKALSEATSGTVTIEAMPPVSPNNVDLARDEYDRAVADYQNCLLENTANLSACERQLVAMNGAATILFGRPTKRNTLVNE